MSLTLRTAHALGVGVLLQLIGTAALAAPAAISVIKNADTYTVNASAEVQASPATVWSVLTDFNHFADFVPDMRVSRVVSVSGNSVVVEQQGIADLLLFHRQVYAVVAVELSPPNRIDFHSLSGNLRTMSGIWRITPAGSGCRIDYLSVSVPDFWTPPLISSLLIRTQIAEQLDGVLAEIDRRAREMRSDPTAP